ncbi:hypothetical protein GPK34_09830 [Secundilactobacillus kimchicus]|uniref:hypothetical protein n=1 Tax=Secundilactobacillus kimchicus TaxID=528209 RepID=UPI001C017E77|nr:hypothetical protein [Secundilactobacillus kimchicus]MBT9672332.1 hypothetical protein [Secundilactobacillus kimchicus]
MKKRLRFILPMLVLCLLLASCGRPTLSVSHHQVTPDGLAAVINGKSRQSHIAYRINNGTTHQQKTVNGQFSITIPSATTAQRVTLKAGGHQTTVTVTRQTPLVTYQALRETYNQGLAVSALSSKDQRVAEGLALQSASVQSRLSQAQAAIKKAQKRVKAGDTVARATLNRQLKEAASLKRSVAILGQTKTSLAPAMAKATTATKDDQLPAQPTSGLHNLVTTNKTTIRAALDGDQVTGLALMVPTSQLKGQKARHFVTTFSLVAQSVGANAKNVLKQFQKQANGKNTSQTTTPKLHSNGITFSLGYSTSTLYVYITK